VSSSARSASLGAAALALALTTGCGPGVVGGALFAGAQTRPQPTPGPTGSSPGGQIVISVPTPAPVVCTPSPVSIPVGQRMVIECSAQNYSGPLSFSIADPATAVVTLATGTYTFFYVAGLAVGTTTVTFQSQPGGTGSEQIIVMP
jgi:hypothetical protein